MTLSTSRCDRLAKARIDDGKLIIDTATGAITRPNGSRAEVLDKRLGYGRVCVQSRPLTWAMAHRIVWIAANGLIPDGLQVNHRNRRRWDNRLDNLELVSPKGNSHHAAGYGYDSIGGDGLDVGWLQRLDRGEPAPKLINPYDHERKADWRLFC